jgi:hypothetical protein
MPLPKNINFDRVIAEILGDMEHVAHGWSNGRPQDETALLNRITERLSRNRRKCDVGVETPVNLEVEFYELHRRGLNQTDRHGADFAVTIDIPAENYKKTALFQLKKSRAYKATLTTQQLNETLLLDVIKSRSFVLSVDEERLGFRVRSAQTCRDDIGEDRDSRQFDTEQWDFLVVWLLKWFRCKEGPPTEPDDKNPVEGLLNSFRIDERPLDATFVRQQNLPDGFLPAYSWLYYRFKPKE